MAPPDPRRTPGPDRSPGRSGAARRGGAAGAPHRPGGATGAPRRSGGATGAAHAAGGGNGAAPASGGAAPASGGAAPAPGGGNGVPEPPGGPMPVADALRLLRAGEIELEGRLVDASNTTLRGVISADGVTARCVYKPVRGERPLWDFPDGTLAGREVAAFLVSAATGWDLVPPTVLRDGPLGPGACQLWIDEDEQAEPLLGFVPSRRVPHGWYRILSAQDTDGRGYVLAHADDSRLARLAAFDAVINNADRKGGHVLVDARGHVYGVDHGVTFHVQDKLRTILWGWVHQPLPEQVCRTLGELRTALGGELGGELAAHLATAEIAGIGRRIDRLLDAGSFPAPDDHRPSVPWPPM